MGLCHAGLCDIKPGEALNPEWDTDKPRRMAHAGVQDGGSRQNSQGTDERRPHCALGPCPGWDQSAVSVIHFVHTPTICARGQGPGCKQDLDTPSLCKQFKGGSIRGLREGLMDGCGVLKEGRDTRDPYPGVFRGLGKSEEWIC